MGCAAPVTLFSFYLCTGTMIQTIGIIFFLQLFSLNGATESSIFGGKVSKPHSRPYMASLQFDGHHSCGGILVRDDFVLTSAHCYNSKMAMMVVLGAHDLRKKEKSRQNLEVANYFIHPEYKERQSDYDIMLLKLKNKAKLNKYVKPIGLPKKNGKTPANKACVVAGWGYVAANGPGSHVLKETTEKIELPEKCKQIWQEHFFAKQMICTKFDKKKGGICQGDSGGPLICNSKPQGITAYTFPNDCEKPNYPHVFMDLHFFLPWIKKTMQG